VPIGVASISAGKGLRFLQFSHSCENRHGARVLGYAGDKGHSGFDRLEFL